MEAAERIVEEFKNGSRRLTKDFKSIIETDLPKLVWPE